MLTHLEVSNFKSFNKINIDFDKFNVIIGPNSSGKSNFIQLFKFINDFMDYDLERAISRQGGVEFFCNKFIGTKKPSSFKLSFNYDNKIFRYSVDDKIDLVKISSVDYFFNLFFEGDNFKIGEEKVSIYCNGLNQESNEKIWDDTITISRKNNKINLFTEKDNVNVNELFSDNLIEFIGENISEKDLMILSPLCLIPTDWSSLLRRLSFYDFDPKLCKQWSGSGNFELSKNGENLSTVLHFILSNKEHKRKFINLVHNLLPFIEDIKSEKVIDSFILNIYEKYSNELKIPSLFISDGTSIIFALICVLYFEEYNKAIFIEEPERYIHPALFSNVIQMMEEVKDNKQIFITTHNPEILTHISNNYIYICRRDKEGFSFISKMIDSNLSEFADLMGVEELILNGML